ncbi:MAG: hypothetical protein L6R40_001312 [Gallowayella cf. fulva]|nr:MAG: hypothetical protein L6R40_001312 [Xanthomendoza cf. fulva]
MCTWFCETFCCFLLRFRNWMRNPDDDIDGDDRLESGHSIYALHDLPRQHQQHQPPPSRPIPLAPTYRGGPPTSNTKNGSPPRLAPRSVPLPVRYPPTETPTGKHFPHESPPPDRMKPLPPLRTTFDGGGIGVEKGNGGVIDRSSVSKPTTSTGSATFHTPPTPAYISAAPPELSTTSTASGPRAGAGGGFPFLQEIDKPFSVQSSIILPIFLFHPLLTRLPYPSLSPLSADKNNLRARKNPLCFSICIIFFSDPFSIRFFARQKDQQYVRHAEHVYSDNEVATTTEPRLVISRLGTA